MTDQIIPYGGTVEVSADGVTYAAVPEVKGMPLPNAQQEYVEVTSLDSPNRYREFIAGLIDPGEVTFVVGYTPAGYAQLDAFGSDLTYFQCTMPQAPSQSTGGDVFTFTGYITIAMDAGDVGAAVNMNVTVKISGDITWAQGS